MNVTENYTLTLKKGQENGLVISEEVFNESDILFDTFVKAKEAVLEIINRSKLINRNDYGEDNEQLSYKLYGFSQNIVVFSGLRGQGKTSAMISFSNYLSKIKSEEKGDLCNFRFKVLPPIDPTILGKGQNILTIILSRLYRYAESIYVKNTCIVPQDNNPYGECQKNRILRKIEECMRDICTLKSDNKECRGLNNLHEIADTNELKRKFYQLVDDILAYESSFRDVGLSNRFLVLQMDDTDFQVNRGYEILDDIRRYLTIPNLIILMATDMDILRKEIIQKYLRDFEFSIKHNQLKDIKMISNIGIKYINKLIPPLYMASLPQVYELVRDYYSNVHLKYINNDENSSLIAPESERLINSLNMQETILRMIYRKTRLVFAAPSGYLHNIIPTTLRGLSQFMGLLNSMGDLEDDAYGTVSELLGIKIDDWKNFDVNVAKRMQKNLIVLLNNIELLEDYFINNWIPTKLGEEDRYHFNKIAEAMPSEWYHLIYNIVSPKIEENSEKGKRITSEDAISALKNYIDDSKSLERYLFFGAIRIFITIKNNKYVFNKMLKTINEKLNEEMWIKNPQQISFDLKEIRNPNLFLCDGRNYIHRLGKLLKQEIESGDGRASSDSKMVRYVISALILSNWDVQDKIMKEFELPKHSNYLKLISKYNDKLEIVEKFEIIMNMISVDKENMISVDKKEKMEELYDYVSGRDLVLNNEADLAVDEILESCKCSKLSREKCSKKQNTCKESKVELKTTGLCKGELCDLINKIRELLNDRTDNKFNKPLIEKGMADIFINISQNGIPNINFSNENFRAENPEFIMLKWDLIRIFDAEILNGNDVYR